MARGSALPARAVGAMSKKRRKPAASPLSFFDDVAGLRAHCRRVFGDLDARLDAEGGITFVDDCLPPDVADLIAKPISDVLTARSGQLLGIGILVGLWSVGSFIETMRDILRRAYDQRGGGLPIWRYRLGSFALIIGSVLLMLIAFAAQVILTGVEQFVERIIPWADQALSLIAWGRIAPVVALFVALYLLFATLTPIKYRRGCAKWPGAVLTTTVWILTTMLLPVILGSLRPYDLTYGSLAGVMIALIFFWVVGLGFVLGAELNAALAQTPQNRLEEAPDETTGYE